MVLLLKSTTPCLFPIIYLVFRLNTAISVGFTCYEQYFEPHSLPDACKTSTCMDH